jgi:hypothetical protein
MSPSQLTEQITQLRADGSDESAAAAAKLEHDAAKPKRSASKPRAKSSARKSTSAKRGK